MNTLNKTLFGLTAFLIFSFTKPLAISFSNTSIPEAEDYKEDFQQKTTQETVKDCEGNIYHTVTIGNQVWMIENLKTTKYNDCTPIPNVKYAIEWGKQTTGAYCDYKNEPKNAATYGRLYNFYTITNNPSIAPKGWHVASLEEWNTLIAYLGGNDVAGGKLKEAGLAHWPEPNKDADNSSGFTGLPGGNRARESGSFYAIGQYGYFWTSTPYRTKDAYMMTLLLYNGAAREASSAGIANGYSIRCIKD